MEAVTFTSTLLESKREMYHTIVGNDSFYIFLATLWFCLHLRTFHKYQNGPLVKTPDPQFACLNPLEMYPLDVIQT